MKGASRVDHARHQRTKFADWFLLTVWDTGVLDCQIKRRSDMINDGVKLN